MPRFQIPRLKTTIRPTAMSSSGAHPHGRVLPGRELEAPGPDVLVVLDRVDADRPQDDRARAEREDERQDRAHEEVADAAEPRRPPRRLLRAAAA